MCIKFLYRSLFIFLSITILFSCQLFKGDSDKKVIARVHDVFLYEDDLADFSIPLGLTEKDSVSILVEHIDYWAVKQLLLHEAKKNITQKTQIEYNKLVEDYKIDLFTSAFKNAYVQKKMNTLISSEEISEYYKKYKENFLLKEELLNVRYIVLPLKYKDFRATKKAFIRFKEDDINELRKIKLAFKSSILDNNDKWITYDSLTIDLPSIKKIRKKNILFNDKYLEYADKNGKYLVNVNKVKLPGSIAPLDYVEETIKQIILNKRKIALKKQLEKEIKEDALQTKDYQVFE